VKRLGGLLGLVCLVLAFGVSATGVDYIDNFDTDPTGGGFVTTFATDYLVYTSDDSGSFWYDSAGGEIDHWGLSDGDVLTIELDGGGEFVFKSLRFKNSATDYDATISGIGTDAFSLTATKNSSELVLFEAPGGSATVDRIEITSTFVSGRLDDVTIEEPDADPPSFDSITRLTPPDEDTNADTLVFQATFSEEVQYVTIDDFEVTGSSATVTSVSSDTGTTIDLTASGGDLAGYEGIVGIDLAAGQDIADLADNALPAGEPTTDETYTLENTPPTDPTPSSTSHTLSVWSDDNTVDVEW